MTTPNVADLELDVDISVSSPEDYVDNAPPPIPQGTYAFRVLDFDLDRDKTTKKVRKSKSGFPTLLLRSIEVVEGPYMGRRVGFQRYSFKPFTREKSGKTATVSQVSDLIRGIDRDATFTTPQDVLDILAQAKDTQQTFRARAHYEGFDKEWFMAQAQSKGISTNDYTSAEAKELRKAATLSGKKDFPTGHVGIGPGGRPIEARVVVSDIYPQKETATE